MTKLQQLFDKSAIGISILCVVHCLFLPLLILVMAPVVGIEFLNSESFHLWLVFAVMPVSLLALYLGYVRHRNLSILFQTMLGLVLLILAVMLGHELVGEIGEVLLTVVGSSVIAYGHYRNYQLVRTQGCPTPN